LATTTCWGVNWSIIAVMPLSRPHATQAAITSNAPTSSDAPASHTSNAPATTTTVDPITTFLPICSRNTRAASTTVATSSVLSRIDADAALVRASPAINNTGPTAPPATTATSAGRHCARSARRLGGAARRAGAVAAAAPR